jgi:hypothetical protein
MKKININSAFVICGLIVLACITLSIISYTEELPVTQKNYLLQGSLQ